jgi:hypothetical protein
VSEHSDRHDLVTVFASRLYGTKETLGVGCRSNANEQVKDSDPDGGPKRQV